MDQDEVGEVIANRVLTMELGETRKQEVIVTLAKPQPDGRDFYCA